MFKFQQDGNKSGVPVISIDNIREKVECGKAIQNCAAEEGKSLGVVVIAVITFASKIFLVVDEIVSHAVKFVLVNADILRAP